MLRRVALRSLRTKSALTRPNLRSFSTQEIQNCTVTEENTGAKGEDNSIIAKYGLDDWKISAPIGVALAIPALSQGFYVINEETQLAACFFLFCTSVYKFGGEAISSYFDARADAILQEQNAIEDASIELAKETLKAHESVLTVQDDVATVALAHKEALELMCKVQTYKLRHKTREIFIKNLNAIKAIEEEFDHELKDAMVKTATDKVRATILKGGKELKSSALNHAISILSQSDKDDNKQDDIAAMFAKELRAYAKDLQAKQGKVVTLTPEQQAAFQSELDAYMKANGLESAELKAPKECKLELL